MTLLKSYMEILTMIDTLKNEVLNLAYKYNSDELKELYEQIDAFFMERIKIFENFLYTQK